MTPPAGSSCGLVGRGCCLLAELRRRIIELDLDPVKRHKALFLVESLSITLTKAELSDLLALLEVLT